MELIPPTTWRLPVKFAIKSRFDETTFGKFWNNLLFIKRMYVENVKIHFIIPKVDIDVDSVPTLFAY